MPAAHCPTCPPPPRPGPTAGHRTKLLLALLALAWLAAACGPVAS